MTSQSPPSSLLQLRQAIAAPYQKLLLDCDNDAKREKDPERRGRVYWFIERELAAFPTLIQTLLDTGNEENDDDKDEETADDEETEQDEESGEEEEEEESKLRHWIEQKVMNHTFGTEETLRGYLAAHPAAARVENYRGEVPLHNCRTATEARLLLQAWPDGIQARRHRKDGATPLLVACLEGRATDLILLLLEQWPQAALEPARGALPLHWVCGSQGSRGQGQDQLRVITALVKAAAQYTLEQQQQDKDLTENDMVLDKDDDDDDDDDNKSSQDQPPKQQHICSITDDNGYMALHAACEGRASCQVIQYLLQAWPDAARHKTEAGDLPLHLLLEQDISTRNQNNENIKAIAVLLEAYPEAAAVPNGQGQLPLLLACQQQRHYDDDDDSSVATQNLLHNNQQPSVISQLLVQNPAAVQVCHPKTGYPLHVACAAHQSLDNLQCLVESWPEAVGRKCHILKNSKKARKAVALLPLHWLLENGGLYGKHQVAKIQYLMEQAPWTVRVKDDHGNLPLHKIFYRGSDSAMWEVATKFIAAYPASVRVDNTPPTLLRAVLRETYHRQKDSNLNDNANAQQQQQQQQNDNKGTLLEESISPWLIKDPHQPAELPLHRACRHRAPARVLSFLLGQWPDAVRMSSSLGAGNLPLHDYLTPKRFCSSSRENPDELAMVQLLVQLWPQSLLQVGKDGFLPFQLAIQEDDWPSIQVYLLNQTREICRQQPHFATITTKLTTLTTPGDEWYPSEMETYRKLRDKLSDAELRAKMTDDRAYHNVYMAIVGESQDYVNLSTQLLSGQMDDEGMEQILWILRLDRQSNNNTVNRRGTFSTAFVMAQMRQVMLPSPFAMPADDDGSNLLLSKNSSTRGNLLDVLKQSAGRGRGHEGGRGRGRAGLWEVITGRGVDSRTKGPTQTHWKEDSDGTASKENSTMSTTTKHKTNNNNSESDNATSTSTTTKPRTFTKEEARFVGHVLINVLLVTVCQCHAAGLTVANGLCLPSSSSSASLSSQVENEMVHDFVVLARKFWSHVQKSFRIIGSEQDRESRSSLPLLPFVNENAIGLQALWKKLLDSKNIMDDVNANLW